MGSTSITTESAGEAPPPPIGPPAVDPTAPPLSPECFGVEKQGERRGKPPQQSTVAAVASVPAPLAAATAENESTGESGPRRQFNTELDVCAIDDRGRPGPVWSARARELSRGELVFFSRRMCYVGKQKLVLIHLIDHSPVAVYGVVESCDYEGDGLYRVDLTFRPIPVNRYVLDWIEARRGRGRRP